MEGNWNKYVGKKRVEKTKDIGPSYGENQVRYKKHSLVQPLWKKV